MNAILIDIKEHWVLIIFDDTVTNIPSDFIEGDVIICFFFVVSICFVYKMCDFF
jgi:hypothetical protein